MKPWIAFLLLLSISIGHAQSLLDEAQSADARGEYLLAADVYRTIVESDAPEAERAEAQMRLADLLYTILDDLEASQRAYQVIIDRFPDSEYADNAHYLIGKILWRQRRYQAAARRFEMILRDYPDTELEDVDLLLEWCRREIPPEEPGSDIERLRATGTDIRVLCFTGSSCTIRAKRPFVVLDARRGTRLLQQSECRLQAGGRQVRLPLGLRTPEIRIVAADTPLIIVDAQGHGRAYRGPLVARVYRGRLQVVSELDVETYLRGVVPGEVPHTWPMEALMAQAIAARTYVLFRRLRRGGASWYDVDSTTRFQVYGGIQAGRRRTNRAVALTHGMVLTYRGRLIDAVYSANSGGYTASARIVWGTDVPYLQAVSDPYSVNRPTSRAYRWRSPPVTLDWMVTRLGRIGYRIRRPKGIEVRHHPTTGRAQTVLVRHAGGTLRVPAERFARAMGVRIIRNTMFRLRHASKSIVFEGVGNGHSVGMSQEGAAEMARQGVDHERILQSYYREVIIESVE